MLKRINVVIIEEIGKRGFFSVGGWKEKLIRGKDLVGEGFEKIWECKKNVGRIE